MSRHRVRFVRQASSCEGDRTMPANILKLPRTTLNDCQKLASTTERSQLIQLVHDDAGRELQGTCPRVAGEMQVCIRVSCKALLHKDLWPGPCHGSEDVTNSNLTPVVVLSPSA